MSVFDIYAGIAYLLLDVMAFLSVVGSAILAIVSIISASSGRQFRAPEKIYMWSIGGLFVGIFGLVSFTLSGEYSKVETTPFFDLSMTTVWLLYALSASLLVVSQVVRRRNRRITFPKSKRVVR
jgi:hypothetical protein